MLTLLGYDPDELFSWEPAGGTLDAPSAATPFPTPTTVSVALRRFVDLHSPPKRSLLRTLSSYATDRAERERLQELSSDPAEYHLVIAIVIQQYPERSVLYHRIENCCWSRS